MGSKVYYFSVSLLLIGIALIAFKKLGWLELPKELSSYPIAGSLVIAGLVGIATPLVQKWGE